MTNRTQYQVKGSFEMSIELADDYEDWGAMLKDITSEIRRQLPAGCSVDIDSIEQTIEYT